MKNLDAALLRAQIAARKVTLPSDGFNEQFMKGYTRATTFVSAAMNLLNAEGVVIKPLRLGVRAGTPGKNGVVPYDVVRTIALSHPESGEREAVDVEWPIDMQGGKRSRDKAVSAADTMLLGYFCRDLLGLGGNESDNEQTAAAHSNSRGARPPRGATHPPRSRGPKARASRQGAPVRGVAEQPDQEAPKQADREAKAPPPVTEPEEAKVVTVRVTTPVTGETSFDVGSGSRLEDPDLLESDVLTALMLGVTPDSLGNTPTELVPYLPVDPGADDLEAAGWERGVAVQLTTFESADHVTRKDVNSMTRLARKAMSLKANQAKEIFTAAFTAVGVDVPSGQTPNGYQLRLWAVRVLQLEAVA